MKDRVTEAREAAKRMRDYLGRTCMTNEDFVSVVTIISHLEWALESRQNWIEASKASIEWGEATQKVIDWEAAIAKASDFDE